MRKEDVERWVREHPDEALQVVMKLLTPRDLLRVGNRSYMEMFADPLVRFDARELARMPDGGVHSSPPADPPLATLRDPSKTFTEFALIPPSYLVFPYGQKAYAKCGLPEKAGLIEFQGTDHASVIQNALYSLTPNRTWKETVVLKGSFVVKKTIRIPSYTRLIIDGEIKTEPELSPGFNTIENSDPTGGNTAIEVIGGKINGGEVGILFQKVTDFAIIGVELYNVSDDSIRFHYSKNGRISFNYIHDTHHDGIEVNVGCENIDIADNVIVNPGDDGIGVVVINEEYTYRVNIIGNIVVNAPNRGIKVYGGRRITAKGNIVYGAQSYGIEVITWEYPSGVYNKPEDVVVEGNIVMNSGKAGIQVSSVDPYDLVRVIVVNNLVKDSAEHGIWLYHVKGVVANNNICEGNNGYGIGMSTSSSVSVIGNKLINNASHGIYTHNSLNIVIDGNIVEENEGAGIDIDTSESSWDGDIVVKGNVVRGNSLHGILVYHVNRVVINGNRVRENGNSGIYISTAELNIIINNIVELNQHHGTYLRNCNCHVIVANIVVKNARDTSANYSGIVIETPTSGYGQYNLVLGNFIDDPDEQQDKCIRETGYGNNNIIVENLVRRCKNPPCIAIVGANTVVKRNVGYLTENKGIATFSGDGTTTEFRIEHGLVSTPSKYTADPLTPDAQASRTVTADDTYIIITYDTAPPSGTDNLKFYWEAEV